MENENSLISIDSVGAMILDSPIEDVATDYAEIGLDTLFQDGSILEQLPIIKTGIAAFRIGKTIHDRIELKKLIVFLQELKCGSPEKEKLEKRKLAYRNGEKWFLAEVEHISIYLSRQADYKKVKLLAEIYIDLINGEITESQFKEYLDILDRLFFSDCEVLLKHYWAEKAHTPPLRRNGDEEEEKWRPKCATAPCNRLSAIGLLNALYGMRYGFSHADYYDITEQGRYFAEICIRLQKHHNTEKDGED